MTLQKVVKPAKSTEIPVRPILFDITDQRKRKEFDFLINSSFSPYIVDEIEVQLEELMKINHPSRELSKQEVKSLSQAHIGDSDLYSYGIWVYYPWKNTFVHLLPQEEFIKLRTCRNQYKITAEEQKTLATKKVGIVGLSVGQSIALTMTLERTYGEIRIADFDNLELSNLNRIRAGVHELGLPKVALVAREIAEIDPFLNVKCFWNGITEENIDNFMLDNGKLDMVIDECDTIFIKFFMREKAKKYGIPVVMDTSDRGMLDIERFDLEPERKIFHGLVDHLDIEGSKTAHTNEEKVKYALPIIGVNRASERMRASMMEIKQTITTWPQLSSDVALGGAISTNLVRRVFLNQHSSSGRFYADIEDIIPSFAPSETNENPTPIHENFPPLKKEDMLTFATKIQLDDSRITVDQSVEDKILESALLAPSGANCQPWKWLVTDGGYFLFHDKHYSASFNDYEDSASHLAMGCAIENFVLTAESEGFSVKVDNLPLGAESSLKAVLQIFPQSKFALQNSMINDLHKYTALRLTNRKHTKREIINPSTLELLSSLSNEIKGASLHFLTSTEELSAIGELIGKGDQIRLLNKTCHQELFSRELRFTEEENLKYRDGIDIELMELTPSDLLGLEVASDSRVIDLLNKWEAGSGLKKISKNLVTSSSAVGLVTMPGATPMDFIMGGRAVERIWLAATKYKLAFQPMTVLPFFFTRLTQGNGLGFSLKERHELTKMHAEFNQLFTCDPSSGLMFLFRLSTAEKPQKTSLRRHKDDLVYIK